MGTYGKGMRSCCDSVSKPNTPHIPGCPMRPKDGEVVADFESVRGAFDKKTIDQYQILKKDDNTYRIELNGEDKHGICSADDVIRWLSFVAHNALRG